MNVKSKQNDFPIKVGMGDMEALDVLLGLGYYTGPRENGARKIALLHGNSTVILAISSSEKVIGWKKYVSNVLVASEYLA